MRLNALLLGLLATICFSFSLRDTDDRYYQIGFVWVKNPIKFQEYAQRALPLLPKDGQMVVTVQPNVSSLGEKTPHSVTVSNYASKSSHDDFFFRNEAYQELIPLRQEAAEVIIINGFDTKFHHFQPASREALMNGTYHIGLVYGKSKSSYFEDYEQVYNQYGGHTMKVLKPDLVSIGEFDQPDYVEIVHFTSQSDYEDMKESTEYKSLAQKHKKVRRQFISGQTPKMPGM